MQEQKTTGDKSDNKVKKGVLNKKSIKFIFGFLGIIAIALAGWFATYYFSPEMQQRRAAQEYVEEQREKYANDTYGSTTPEGTLQLFVEALEEGDIELASKYFVIDKQSEMEETLQKYKKDGSFPSIIKEGKKLELNKKKKGWAFFALPKDNSVMVILRKNSKGQWKISEL